MARNAVLGFALIVFCWTSLYMRPDRWSNIDTSAEIEVEKRDDKTSQATTSSSTFQPGLSSKDLKKLREYGKKNLYQKFKPQFSESERQQVITAMKVLTDTLDSANITYFLYGGSLIGSWRHHDIIPWDDDLDIIVNISSWEAIEALRFSGYTLNIQTLNRYKFYSNDAKPIPGYFWSWPYIDICFFGDNGTHLYDMDPGFSKSFVYDKADVLPLVRRPFAGLKLYAPKNTEKVIKQNYNALECQTRSYDHRRQRSIPNSNITVVDCTILYRLYPFVIRDKSTPGKENLYLDHKLINSVQV